jgi:hypothetical protein
MAALHLVLPEGATPTLSAETNHLQLGLTIALITLLILGSAISAALADKKLQSKEQICAESMPCSASSIRLGCRCNKWPITTP